MKINWGLLVCNSKQIFRIVAIVELLKALIFCLVEEVLGEKFCKVIMEYLAVPLGQFMWA